LHPQEAADAIGQRAVLANFADLDGNGLPVARSKLVFNSEPFPRLRVEVVAMDKQVRTTVIRLDESVVPIWIPENDNA